MSDLRVKSVTPLAPSVRLQTIGHWNFLPDLGAAREVTPANLHPKGQRGKCRPYVNPTRGTMHPGTTYLVVGLAALAGACASQSDTIPPTYVSPSTYENLTCRQLGEEVKRVTRAEAASAQTGKPADAADVGLFKGTMDALEQVSIEKGCNIQFQHG
jgi:hypothetical protein